MSNTLIPVLVGSLQLGHLAAESLGRFPPAPLAVRVRALQRASGRGARAARLRASVQKRLRRAGRS
ncbi:hypothetical protein, partial [Candidatus Nephthysia bennettiae]|uniref:hypothetical protein n=1 Tax=Candidatus Nephthysia bennettiae TaxID=3127016 RepID=UPI0030C6FF0C